MAHRRPLRKAVDEAGIVLLGSIIAAVAFNVFSANKVAWIAHPAGTGDTTTLEELLVPMDTVSISDTNMAGPDTAAPATDSADLEVPDTAASAPPRSDTPASVQRPVSVESLPKEIGTSTAKQIYDRKIAVWFDARQPDNFARGHIPGAHNVYAYDFQNSINKILSLGIPPDKPIVVYCDGGVCELSHDLAGNLQMIGFKKVVVYTGGIEEWEDNNYPVTRED